MAAALDQTDIISGGAAAAAANVSAATVKTVAANGTIFLAISGDGGFTVSSMTAVTGVTWTIVNQSAATDPSIALVRGDCPGGLPSGTTLQANFSGSPTNRIITGMSFTGVGVQDNAPAAVGGSGTTYTSATVSAAEAGEVIVSAVINWTASDTTAPTAPSLEGAEFVSAGPDKDISIEYRIESAAGSFTTAGSFTPNPATAWKAASASFKAAASSVSAPSRLLSMLVQGGLQRAQALMLIHPPSPVTVASLTGSAADTVTVSDGVTRIVTLPRSTTDTVTVSDGVTRDRVAAERARRTR
jgi:hypothetical protein